MAYFACSLGAVAAGETSLDTVFVLELRGTYFLSLSTLFGFLADDFDSCFRFVILEVVFACAFPISSPINCLTRSSPDSTACQNSLMIASSSAGDFALLALFLADLQAVKLSCGTLRVVLANRDSSMLGKG